jgi:uncharacterized membrane protein
MRVGKYIFGTIFIAAGIGHFLITRTYENIMPDYLPAHRDLVLLSGAAEMLGGIGVMTSKYQRAAAWGLVMLLIAVMPANIWMAQHPERYPGIPLWAIWTRLPLQLPLIWWAWLYTRDRRELLA